MRMGKNTIYADAAASTPISAAARRELIRLLGLYANPGALHKGAVEAKNELEAARERVATAIGAHEEEIFFTSGGTECNNLAILGAIRPLLLEHGELHAITSSIEHASILEPLRALERDGLYTSELPVSQEGLIDVALLADSINDETVLISVQAVNGEIGAIEPLRAIAKEIRRVRKERAAAGNELPLYFHTDASQAPLWQELKVDSLGVDLMTIDGQKIEGPRGAGALYVRRSAHLEPILFGGGQQNGLRSGTENLALDGSLSVALADAQKNAASCAETIAAVRDLLFAELKKLIPDIVLHGPSIETNREARVANNLNVSLKGLDAEMAVIALDAKGIAASTRSACSTGDTEPSHVIAALEVPQELAKTAVRLTLLPNATKRDARHIAHTFSEVVKKYRTVIY